MYPQAELTHLAVRNVNLRRVIAARRAACASAAERAAKPLIWLDRAIVLLQRAAPLLPILSAPIALFAARKSAMKTSLLQSVMKWGPLVFQATRHASSAFSRKAAVRRAASAGHAPTPLRPS